MKQLLKEYSINKIINQVFVRDHFIVTAKKQYDLWIKKVNPDSIIATLNNKDYLIKRDGLQGKTLYFSEIVNNAISKSGSIKDILEIRVIRGYDTIAKINTKFPAITADRLKGLKEAFIEAKDNLAKVKVGDEIAIQTAFLKESEDEDDKDLIDEGTITTIKLSVDEEVDPSKHIFNCTVNIIKGYLTNQYKNILNQQVSLNSEGLSFNPKVDGGDTSGSYLKVRVIADKNVVNITDIFSIEVEESQEDPETAKKKEKQYSDREIFKMVVNDPVMGNLLKSKPNFWDFILGKTHDQSIDSTIQTLRGIKSNINPSGGGKKSSLTGKIYTIQITGPDITGNPKFKLEQGEKYTAKVLNVLKNKTTIGIYELNKINNSQSIYTMDIYDKLRKDNNVGKVYYGGKTENKTRQFVGNGQISIK